MFLGENDVEVAESLASWVQNKQRTKQQNNRDTVTDTCRYIYRCHNIKTIGKRIYIIINIENNYFQWNRNTARNRLTLHKFIFLYLSRTTFHLSV